MDKSVQRYNTEKAINLYYRMQFAPYIAESVPQLTEPFYQEIIETVSRLPNVREVCEVGCGLGRVLFDLARTSKTLIHAIGTDISESFIQECKKIRDGHSRISSTFAAESVSKIEFQVVDAQQLSLKDNAFDLSICLNVIDRVPHPRAVLSELYRITAPGGHLLITDPYDWNEGYTPRQHQISSMQDVYTTKEWDFISDRDINFEIYSNPRKSIKYRNHLLLLQKK